MWPFSRHPKFQMPAWTYLPVDAEHTELSFSPGRWVVTDGAYVTKDVVDIGHITTNGGFLDLTQTADGLELLTLRYKTEPPVANRPEKILVIDSGDMVFCCEDAFKRGGITLTDHRTSYAFHRTCYAFVKAARLGGKRSKIVLVHDDATQDCVGICASPMWGDGAYRLEFESEGDFQLLRAHLGESC